MTNSYDVIVIGAGPTGLAAGLFLHAHGMRVALLEREVLERDGIERIMAGVPRMERAPGVGLRVVAAASVVDVAGRE